MRVSFDDIFNISEDQKSVSPKKVVRLGGVKLLPDLTITLGEVGPLGFDIIQWLDKEFEVDIDDGVLVITQVYLDPN